MAQSSSGQKPYFSVYLPAFKVHVGWVVTIPSYCFNQMFKALPILTPAAPVPIMTIYCSLVIGTNQ